MKLQDCNTRLSRVISFLAAALIFSSSVFAQSGARIQVNSGATLTVAGGKLMLSCKDIVTIDGGTLSISSGEIENLNLTRRNGGSFNKSGGTVIECDTFFIIMTPEGRAAIINL